MNIETATETNKPKLIHAEGGVLTAELKKLFLKASDICFWFTPGDQTWQTNLAVSLTFKKKDVETRIEVTGFHGVISRGYANELATRPAHYDGSFSWPAYVTHSSEPSNYYKPRSGFWSCLYTNSGAHESAVLRSLPVGSRLTFTVRLDWHSNDAMFRAGIHGDVLELTASGKRELTFTFDTATGPLNSARFGWRSATGQKE